MGEHLRGGPLVWTIRDARSIPGSVKHLLHVVASRGESGSTTAWETVAGDMGVGKDAFYAARRTALELGLLLESRRWNDTTVYLVNVEVLRTYLPDSGNPETVSAGLSGNPETMAPEQAVGRTGNPDDHSGNPESHSGIPDGESGNPEPKKNLQNDTEPSEPLRRRLGRLADHVEPVEDTPTDDVGPWRPGVEEIFAEAERSGRQKRPRVT